jgi:RNA polymerase sigma-70 factor (ECF subfamily)
MQNSLTKIAQNDFDIIFKDLFKDNYVSLLGYCNSYIKDVVVAKDIVQDSFKALWEKRTIWCSNSNVKQILFTIVRNKSINYLKHQKIELKYASDFRRDYLNAELNLTAIEYDGSDFLIADELNDCIETAINELPDRCKQILELSRKKEMKNREIAEELSISIKTVESQMTKALKYLRNRLKDLAN